MPKSAGGNCYFGHFWSSELHTGNSIWVTRYDLLLEGKRGKITAGRERKGGAERIEACKNQPLVFCSWFHFDIYCRQCGQTYPNVMPHAAILILYSNLWGNGADRLQFPPISPVRAKFGMRINPFSMHTYLLLHIFCFCTFFCQYVCIMFFVMGGQLWWANASTGSLPS